MNSDSGERFMAAHAGDRILSIAASYLRLIGKPLVAPDLPLTPELWRAPRAILAHGTEADPIFFYGNKMALSLFEMSAQDFVRMPSRLSAETLRQAERALLLARVARDGFIDDYSGIRISATGRRFRIERAIVWTLTDERGTQIGQAATFDQWTALDGPSSQASTPNRT